ncbi:MAG: DUF308 domain-containing protein [Acidimicrobiia bacterium]|nr:DUF308 domain-containing protein [Acidimicrobiia bacterium]
MATREEVKEAVVDIAKWWWLWLVVGIAWIVVAMIILQLNAASVRTVGFIVGAMLFVAGVQYLLVAMVAEGWKWLWGIFGIVLVVSGTTAMLNPARAFANVADMLGFLFAFVGIIWVVEALAIKGFSDFWWLTLLSGILMLIIAFWVGGQFFFDKAYMLLVFAGMWALMKGFLDILRAFQIRVVGKIAAQL